MMMMMMMMMMMIFRGDVDLLISLHHVGLESDFNNQFYKISEVFQTNIDLQMFMQQELARALTHTHTHTHTEGEKKLYHCKTEI